MMPNSLSVSLDSNSLALLEKMCKRLESIDENISKRLETINENISKRLDSMDMKLSTIVDKFKNDGGTPNSSTSSPVLQDKNVMEMDDSFDNVIGTQPQQNVIAANQPDENFLEYLSKSIEDWTRLKAKAVKFSSLDLNGHPRGKYFDVVCKVLSIVSPKPEFPDKPLNICVCDGTKLPIANSYSPLAFSLQENFYTTKSGLFDSQQSNYDKIKDYVHYIACYDEYGEQAMKLNPGDIIEIRNVHVKEKGSNYYFSLHGAHGKHFNRGIYVLEPSKNGNSK